MGEHNLTLLTAPETGAVNHCAMRLLRLEGLFRSIACSCNLSSELTRGWPGLAICKKRWLVVRRLELRLQPDYLRDYREYYELRFVETGPGLTGIRTRHDFGCGRMSADELLSHPRVARCVHQKLALLGLAGPLGSADQTSASPDGWRAPTGAGTREAERHSGLSLTGRARCKGADIRKSLKNHNN